MRKWEEDVWEVLEKMRKLKGGKEEISIVNLKRKLGQLREQGRNMSREMEKLRKEVKK